MARFACGSMVLFFLVHKKNSQREFFCEQAWNLPPCRRRNVLSGLGLRNFCKTKNSMLRSSTCDPHATILVTPRITGQSFGWTAGLIGIGEHISNSAYTNNIVGVKFMAEIAHVPANQITRAGLIGAFAIDRAGQIKK